MKNILKRSVLVALVAVLLLPAFFFAFPQRASAAQSNPKDQLERWFYYRGMRACLAGGHSGDLERQDIIDGKWGFGSQEGFGYLGPDMDDDNGNDGIVECSDGSIWVRGANIFGFGTRNDTPEGPLKFFCALNRALNDLGDTDAIIPNNEDDCERSTKFKTNGNFSSGNSWQEALTKALENEGSKDRPRLDINDNNGPSDSYSYKALLYLIGAYSLPLFCNSGGSLADGVDNLTNDEHHVIVDIVSDADGSIAQNQIYKLSGHRDNQDDETSGVYYKHDGDWDKANDLNCDDIALLTQNENAEAYADWVKKNPDQAPGNQNPGGSGDNSPEAPSCWSTSGPLAWLLCAALDVIDNAVAQLDNWIQSLLFVDPSTYGSEGVKAGNAIMRNIALLLLVPMMMFMVIGTALNFGPFDPYTVKKALPRMMVATIFIVISLPLTQFAVYLSNITGQGIGNLITAASAAGDLEPVTSLSSIVGQNDTGNIFGSLFVGGIAVSTFFVSIGVIGSFALVTLIALLIGFIILVMREVLITVLIVLAPLAIIVWIFPGNDKLWGIWKGTFTAMLLMYPIISILLAAGKFVAAIIGATS